MAGEDLIGTLVGFARTLRAAGVDASADRVHSFVAALRHLDVLDAGQVYWAGRLTLCGGLDDIDRYDRCFAAYFSGRVPVRRRAPAPVTVIRQIPVLDESGAGASDERESSARSSTASTIEVLRDRDVARLSEAEKAEVNRLLALLRTGAALRRTRRFTPAHRGRLDRARTVREALRHGGETAVLRRRTHTRRPRRVVLLIDVSGSMSPYADALLRFAHAAVRGGGRRTEAFSVGTRLTRLTRELRHADADTALTAVSTAIPDWSGGTRLGDELKEFLDVYGQRGLARGAIVVIASDGWERGDVSVLATQMARLARLAYRVIWANPHKAQPGYEPLAAGMAAALPYVDAFIAGHSLGALEHLAAVIGAERAAPGGAPRAQEGAHHA